MKYLQLPSAFCRLEMKTEISDYPSVLQLASGIAGIWFRRSGFQVPTLFGWGRERGQVLNSGTVSGSFGKASC